ncbi:MAG: tRNA (adenosine(37)-N6)-threonylcarbamoyltransferase complex ATPase subunit type 1 TsaE, partial [Prosthecobacter sp.]|nr:tRNA (adenosine(37)-N6)-threonylcarbamoyltransferase complex ATPase subunit type 1 TsaE [Prosthecobacter sp.]
LSLDLQDETFCEHWAAAMADCLRAPAILTFRGEIGAGKTTFIRAMLRALGVRGAIKSPTFSLVESYDCDNLHVHHFDLYRIVEEGELDYLGFRDYFDSEGVCCIEWPERAGAYLTHSDLHFELTIRGSGRLMRIEALSAAGESMLSCLVGKQ